MLTGVKSVVLVEREHLKKVLESHQNLKGTELRKLLGADLLLVGSFAVFNEKIRIQARVVQAQSGEISKSFAFSATGLLKDIFQLQSSLSSRLSESFGLGVDENRLSLQLGRNLNSYQSFGEGMLAYNKGLWSNAIKLFLLAQQQNEGMYFSEAHYWEGKARIAEANNETEDDKKEELRKNHVRKFREDAAEAAPAFFLEANSYPFEKVPLSNLFVSMLRAMEVPCERWIDSTGPLAGV
jgi:hypothetical protein